MTDEATAKLRRNESRKRAATFLNSVGVAFLVAAVLQPILLFVQQGFFGSPSVIFSTGFVILASISVVTAHLVIRRLEA